MVSYQRITLLDYDSLAIVTTAAVVKLYRYESYHSTRRRNMKIEPTSGSWKSEECYRSMEGSVTHSREFCTRAAMNLFRLEDVVIVFVEPQILS